MKQKRNEKIHCVGFNGKLQKQEERMSEIRDRVKLIS